MTRVRGSTETSASLSPREERRKRNRKRRKKGNRKIITGSGMIDISDSRGSFWGAFGPSRHRALIVG